MKTINQGLSDMKSAPKKNIGNVLSSGQRCDFENGMDLREGTYFMVDLCWCVLNLWTLCLPSLDPTKSFVVRQHDA